MSRGPNYTTRHNVALHSTLPDFKCVFGHPQCEFEREFGVVGYTQSALLLVTQTGFSTIAKARWLVDHGASVGALLKYRGEHSQGGIDWRRRCRKVPALERLFRKHYAMVVRLIDLHADVPPLPLVLEQKVASFLV